MTEDGKSRMVAGDQSSQHYYGTFQGVANYYPPLPQPPSHPVVGFPQLVAQSGLPAHPPYQHHYGYQTVPAYALIDARPLREAPLPCCGIGVGWILFIIGFFLGGIPWYLGTFILLFVRVDYREKPGYVACMIASVIAVIAVLLGVTKGAHARLSSIF